MAEDAALSEAGRQAAVLVRLLLRPRVAALEELRATLRALDAAEDAAAAAAAAAGAAAPAPPAPPREDEAAAALAALGAWLEARGAALPRVRLARIPALGCNGVVCSEALSKGSLALRVPRSAMLCVETHAEPWLSALAAQDALLRSTETAALALLVLQEEAKGTRSEFAPYLSALPRAFPGLPLFWGAAELLLLEHSPAGELATRRAANVAAYFCYLRPRVRPWLRLRWDDWQRAMALVMTRQNPLPRRGAGQTLALIPLFDMCNHEQGELASHFDPRDDALQCHAMRAFAKDEEFRIHYGPRDNAELLVYSGFTLPDNAADRALLPLRFAEADLLAKAKRTLRADEGWLAAPSDALPFCRLAVADKDELAAALRGDKGAQPISHANEQRAAAMMLGAARALASNLQRALDGLAAQSAPNPLVVNLVATLLGAQVRLLHAFLAAEAQASSET